MSVRFGARRPSSPEAVRPYFLSRAIRQALIRAPRFGPAVLIYTPNRPSDALSLPATPIPSHTLPIPHTLIPPNRPYCSLSDRAPRFTYPEASTRVLYAVLVCYTTTALNSPYFETSCENAVCSTDFLSLPHAVRPHTSFYPPRRLCTRFIRRPSLLHYDGSKLAVFLNVVRKCTMFDRPP